MPRSTATEPPHRPLDVRALWLAELDRVASDQRWGRLLIVLAAVHLVGASLCQTAFLTVGPTVRWLYPMLWLAELGSALLIARTLNGPGWMTASPMSSVLVRVWATYLILCFSLASLNAWSGWSHDWFKPIWCTIGTFGFATMAWLVSLWFLIPAFQLYFTALLMVKFPEWNFLIHGLSFGLALTGIGVVLERRRLAGLAPPSALPAPPRHGERAAFDLQVFSS